MADYWNYDMLCKILVIGDSSVGKSQLLLRYCENDFGDTHSMTIGIDFKLKTEIIDSKHVKCQIWDTAGQERFRTITHTYYHGANGVLLVYDITNPDTFKNIPTWIEDVKQYAPENVSMVLVGNKSDLKHKRLVSYEMGHEFAKEHGMEFYETSAKTSQGVEEVFHGILKKMIESKNYMSNSLVTKVYDNQQTTRLTGQRTNTISCCNV
jgi:Ras-related protein Rab-1A